MYNPLPHVGQQQQQHTQQPSAHQQRPSHVEAYLNALPHVTSALGGHAAVASGDRGAGDGIADGGYGNATSLAASHRGLGIGAGISVEDDATPHFSNTLPHSSPHQQQQQQQCPQKEGDSTQSSDSADSEGEGNAAGGRLSRLARSVFPSFFSSKNKNTKDRGGPLEEPLCGGGNTGSSSSNRRKHNQEEMRTYPPPATGAAGGSSSPDVHQYYLMNDAAATNANAVSGKQQQQQQYQPLDSPTAAPHHLPNFPLMMNTSTEQSGLARSPGQCKGGTHTSATATGGEGGGGGGVFALLASLLLFGAPPRRHGGNSSSGMSGGSAQQKPSWRCFGEGFISLTTLAGLIVLLTVVATTVAVGATLYIFSIESAEAAARSSTEMLMEKTEMRLYSLINSADYLSSSIQFAVRAQRRYPLPTDDPLTEYVVSQFSDNCSRGVDMNIGGGDSSFSSSSESQSSATICSSSATCGGDEGPAPTPTPAMPTMVNGSIDGRYAVRWWLKWQTLSLHQAHFSELQMIRFGFSDGTRVGTSRFGGDASPWSKTFFTVLNGTNDSHYAIGGGGGGGGGPPPPPSGGNGFGPEGFVPNMDTLRSGVGESSPESPHRQLVWAGDDGEVEWESVPLPPLPERIGFATAAAAMDSSSSSTSLSFPATSESSTAVTGIPQQQAWNSSNNGTLSRLPFSSIVEVVLSQDGDEVSRIMKPDAYDPRTQPFYGAETGPFERSWSHVSFPAFSGIPIIRHTFSLFNSSGVYLGQGEMQLRLDSLRRLASSRRPTEGTVVYVLDEKSNVVVTSHRQQLAYTTTRVRWNFNISARDSLVERCALSAVSELHPFARRYLYCTTNVSTFGSPLLEEAYNDVPPIPAIGSTSSNTNNGADSCEGKSGSGGDNNCAAPPAATPRPSIVLRRFADGNDYFVMSRTFSYYLSGSDANNIVGGDATELIDDDDAKDREGPEGDTGNNDKNGAKDRDNGMRWRIIVIVPYIEIMRTLTRGLTTALLICTVSGAIIVLIVMLLVKVLFMPLAAVAGAMRSGAYLNEENAAAAAASAAGGGGGVGIEGVDEDFGVTSEDMIASEETLNGTGVKTTANGQRAAKAHRPKPREPSYLSDVAAIQRAYWTMADELRVLKGYIPEHVCAQLLAVKEVGGGAHCSSGAGCSGGGGMGASGMGASSASHYIHHGLDGGPHLSAGGGGGGIHRSISDANSSAASFVLNSDEGAAVYYAHGNGRNTYPPPLRRPLSPESKKKEEEGIGFADRFVGFFRRHFGGAGGGRRQATSGGGYVRPHTEALTDDSVAAADAFGDGLSAPFLSCVEMGVVDVGGPSVHVDVLAGASAGAASPLTPTASPSAPPPFKPLQTSALVMPANTFSASSPNNTAYMCTPRHGYAPPPFLAPPILPPLDPAATAATAGVHQQQHQPAAAPLHPNPNSNAAAHLLPQWQHCSSHNGETFFGANSGGTTVPPPQASSSSPNAFSYNINCANKKSSSTDDADTDDSSDGDGGSQMVLMIPPEALEALAEEEGYDGQPIDPTCVMARVGPPPPPNGGGGTSYPQANGVPPHQQHTVGAIYAAPQGGYAHQSQGCVVGAMQANGYAHHQHHYGFGGYAEGGGGGGEGGYYDYAYDEGDGTMYDENEDDDDGVGDLMLTIPPEALAALAEEEGLSLDAADTRCVVAMPPRHASAAAGPVNQPPNGATVVNNNVTHVYHSGSGGGAAAAAPHVTIVPSAAAASPGLAWGGTAALQPPHGCQPLLSGVDASSPPPLLLPTSDVGGGSPRLSSAAAAAQPPPASMVGGATNAGALSVFEFRSCPTAAQQRDDDVLARRHFNNHNAYNSPHHGGGAAGAGGALLTGTALQSGGAPITAAVLGGGGLENSLSGKYISVAVINLVGFHAYAATTPAARIVRDHEAVVAYIHEAARRCGGVLDTFAGDKFWVSFNATSRCAEHALAATLFACEVAGAINKEAAAHHRYLASQQTGGGIAEAKGGGEGGGNSSQQQRQQQRAPKFRFSAALGGATAGVTTGKAFVGPLGTTRIRRHTIISTAMPQAAALERLATRYPDCGVMVGGDMIPAIEGYFQYLLVDAIALPGSNGKRRRIATVKGPIHCPPLRCFPAHLMPAALAFFGSTPPPPTAAALAFSGSDGKGSADAAATSGKVSSKLARLATSPPAVTSSSSSASASTLTAIGGRAGSNTNSSGSRSGAGGGEGSTSTVMTAKGSKAPRVLPTHNPYADLNACFNAFLEGRSDDVAALLRKISRRVESSLLFHQFGGEAAAAAAAVAAATQPNSNATTCMPNGPPHVSAPTPTAAPPPQFATSSNTKQIAAPRGVPLTAAAGGGYTTVNGNNLGGSNSRPVTPCPTQPSQHPRVSASAELSSAKSSNCRAFDAIVGGSGVAAEVDAEGSSGVAVLAPHECRSMAVAAQGIALLSQQADGRVYRNPVGALF